MSTASAKPNRRERLRAQALADIIDRAMTILDAEGAQAVTFAAVAKAMEMSAPGLYRYFPSREALIDHLALLVHEELADVMESVERETVGLSPEERLRSLTRAYHEWAVRHPMRYDTVFGAGMRDLSEPGEDTENKGGSSAAARGIGVLIAILADRPAAAKPAPVTSALDGQLVRWHRRSGGTTSPDVLRLAIIAWTRVHGIVSLEISGVFDALGIDPLPLLDGEVDALPATWREPLNGA